MLDGIPFGSAGGIVGDGHSQGKGVRQLGLEFGFPGMTAATVATAGISQNEQLAGTAIASGTFLVPPVSDGMSGKGGSVMGNAKDEGDWVAELSASADVTPLLTPVTPRFLGTASSRQRPTAAEVHSRARKSLPPSSRESTDSHRYEREDVCFHAGFRK